MESNFEIDSAVDLIVESKERELVEGFKIRRVLPSVKRRMVGPFIFLDQMGPEILTAGRGLDVAPHPHIGLATVTYLFEGRLLHRDSLGTKQMILPGEVNWMTAGSGIAHSERTPPEIRNSGAKTGLFGIQMWVALPAQAEEKAPIFAHYAAGEIPRSEGEGKIVNIIAGSAYGQDSPVTTSSDLFYVEAAIERGAKLPVSAEYEERAIYIVDGEIEFSAGGGFVYKAGQLLVLKPKEEIVLRAVSKRARVLLLGGEPLNEKRFIWWNFVSSSPERIEQAKADWKAGKFAVVPEETERIPLPADSRPVVARYP